MSANESGVNFSIMLVFRGYPAPCLLQSTCPTSHQTQTRTKTHQTAPVSNRFGPDLQDQEIQVCLEGLFSPHLEESEVNSVAHLYAVHKLKNFGHFSCAFYFEKSLLPSLVFYTDGDCNTSFSIFGICF